MREQLFHEVDAIHLVHKDVHNQHVGQQLDDLLTGLIGVGSLCHHVDVGVLTELFMQGFPQQERVVYDHDFCRLHSVIAFLYTEGAM